LLHPNLLFHRRRFVAHLIQEMSTISYRFRESAFRDFERNIAQAINSFPSVVHHDLRGYSSVTFSCRLRDAMKSYETYCWPSELIDRAAFLSIYPRLQVADRGSYVVSGSREELKASNAQPISAVKSSAVEPFDIGSPTDYKLIAWLAHYELFNRPLKIKLTIEQFEHLNEFYDINLTANNDGTYTIL
jgi:hypothetical protein